MADGERASTAKPSSRPTDLSPSKALSPPRSTSPRKAHAIGSPDRFIASVSRPVYRLDSPTSPSKSARPRQQGSSPTRRPQSLPKRAGPSDSVEFQQSIADALGLPLASSCSAASAASVLQYGPKADRAGATLDSPDRTAAGATLAAKQQRVQRSPGRAAQKRQAPVYLQPWKILAAHGIRDDFYSAPLAWSSTGHLAVALNNYIHMWSDATGHQGFDRDTEARPRAAVSATAVSADGSWLVVARTNGHLALYYPSAPLLWPTRLLVRSETTACMQFRPKSFSSQHEHLTIGFSDGSISHYELGVRRNRARFIRTAEAQVHEQQVCGLAWNDEGILLASGGNDNKIAIFDARHSLEKPRWEAGHESAIKALAFCPFTEGLLASGGGTHDQKLHFWQCTPPRRDRAGTLPVKLKPIASLAVRAQVTGIVWSNLYREVCVTLGYTDPEARRSASARQDQLGAGGGPRTHAAKICVYTWPHLHCIAAIGLDSSATRIVQAISTARVLGIEEVPVPVTATGAAAGSGPGVGAATTVLLRRPHVVDGEDIIVASSDHLIRIYKLWPADRARLWPQVGLGGGRIVLDVDLPHGETWSTHRLR